MARRDLRRKAPLSLRLLTVLGVLLMAASIGGLGMVQVLSARFAGELTRADLLAGIPAPDGAGGARNYLVLGSPPPPDEATEPTTEPTGDPTTDPTGVPAETVIDGPAGTVTLLHIAGDGRSAVVVVIPGDSHVEVPAAGTWPGGLTTLDAALDLGGPNLVARSVYELTQVPLDGVVIIDLKGLSGMVDAVGGVRVCTPFEVRSFFTDTTWTVGCHDLPATEVDEFIGPRTLVPGGEVGRIIIQQTVMMAVLRKATTTEVLTSPVVLNAVFTRSAQSLMVDQRLDVRELAFTLKAIPPANLRYAAVPVVGQVQLETGPATELDVPAADELFAAVRDDTLDAWLAEHPLQLSTGPA